MSTKRTSPGECVVSLERKYKKSLNDQWCLRFKTCHPDGDEFDGVVIQIAREFIVLREEVNFEFDGVVVLPKSRIKGCRDNKYERCRNELLRHNGAIRKCRSVPWLSSCGTLPDVIGKLKARDVWPAIEVVFNGNSRSAFYLGTLTHIGSDRCVLRSYDAAGKWEKAYDLSYDEIFKIEFDNKYCRHFNAFMRSKASGKRGGRNEQPLTDH
jgi:hypothetical protein